MRVELRETPFEPLVELERHQRMSTGLVGRCGATAIFIGTMRDFNDVDAVQGMVLEYYPGMTEKYLRCIVETASREWPLLEVLVVHRVGELRPNDPIVLVAVWSEHRAAAFSACRSIMEELKSKAPFWKRETTAAGSRWVEHNTPG
jgi:molybdopterin synthase catalytic subunit